MRYYKSALVAMFLLPLNAMAFPEIPFCPLGGPPGWYNRMVDNDRYYGPPPPFPAARYLPDYRYYPAYPATPVMQGRPPSVAPTNP